MTLEQISAMIASVGVPYTYHHFAKGEAKPLPFICFSYPQSDDLIADNVNYVGITQLEVDLYTANKDFALQRTLEGVLASNGIAYSSSESYIDSEKCYMETYMMEVLING